MSSLLPEFRFDPPESGPPSGVVNAHFMSLLGGYIDLLVQSADRRDWVAVGRLSTALAEGGMEAGAFELSGAAQQVAVASRSGASNANLRRALLRLIGAYGRARRAPTACSLI